MNKELSRDLLCPSSSWNHVGCIINVCPTINYNSLHAHIGAIYIYYAHNHRIHYYTPSSYNTCMMYEQ